MRLVNFTKMFLEATNQSYTTVDAKFQAKSNGANAELLYAKLAEIRSKRSPETFENWTSAATSRDTGANTSLPRLLMTTELKDHWQSNTA